MCVSESELFLHLRFSSLLLYRSCNTFNQKTSHMDPKNDEEVDSEEEEVSSKKSNLFSEMSATNELLL